MAETRTLKWKCTATESSEKEWQWLSSNLYEGGSVPITGDAVREGTITLPANEDYWYPCINLVLPGVSFGFTYVRYFKQNDQDMLQARVEARVEKAVYWDHKGQERSDISMTNSEGGFDIEVIFV
ncbi:MAG TPA: hypothetical protein VHY08_29070 [Bacillota bacterium]|nr:hypothetical protein [Bacillota bacterium]